MAIAQMDIRRPGKANERTVTICSMGDIRLIEGGIGRAGRMQAKAFPLDTGIEGVGMEFAWTHYFPGYGTPRRVSKGPGTLTPTPRMRLGSVPASSIAVRTRSAARSKACPGS